MIVQVDQQFTTVVAVDEPDFVGRRQTLRDSQAAARHDEPRKAGRDFESQAGRNRRRFSGWDADRVGNAGKEVCSGRTGRLTLRQPGVRPEQLYADFWCHLISGMEVPTWAAGEEMPRLLNFIYDSGHMRGFLTSTLTGGPSILSETVREGTKVAPAAGESEAVPSLHKTTPAGAASGLALLPRQGS